MRLKNLKAYHWFCENVTFENMDIMDEVIDEYLVWWWYKDRDIDLGLLRLKLSLMSEKERERYKERYVRKILEAVIELNKIEER